MDGKQGGAGEGGFTLLEMLVALAIVTVAAGAVTRTLVTGIVLSTRAAREMQALDVARNALTVTEASGDAPAVLTARLDGFERNVTVRPRPDLVNPSVPGIPVPRQIDVVVRWRDGARVRNVTLSTLRLDASL